MKTKFVVLAFVVAVFVSCSKEDMTGASTQPNSSATASTARMTANDGNVPNSGVMNTIPAYYDGKLFNIIFVELPPAAEASLIAHNNSINVIYQSDPGLPGGKPFISVLDAIQGDGYNPLWREAQITFVGGVASAHQFTSDNDILAAASGDHPEITIEMTNEVYKCPVVGKK